MANPYKDSFDFVVACYGEWAMAMRKPWSVAAQLLAGGSSGDHVKRATGFWFSSFFLSLIVGLPIYVVFGLKLESVSFQLCAILAQYVTMLGFAALFHLALRWHKIPSDFGDTFTLYTVVSAAFGPLITLLSLPAIFRSLLITSQVKGKGLPFMPAAKAMLVAAFRGDDSFSSLLMSAADPILALLGFFVLATFVQLLSEHYGASEATVVRAVGFALGVMCPGLTIAVIVLQQALWFAFVT